jgi:Putative sensor
MSESINDYLSELKNALRGSDPATIQDALSDAEEHLWTAWQQAQKGSPEQCKQKLLTLEIEKYGPAAEVAAAYQEIERRIRPTLATIPNDQQPSAAERFFGIFIDPSAYASLFYMFFSFFLCCFNFIWTMAGLSISLGTMLLVVGRPFLGLFLMSVRGIALVNGRIIEALLGVRMPRRPIFARKPRTWRERLSILFRDPMVWKTITYNVLMLPLGVLFFSLTIMSVSISLALMLQPMLTHFFHLPLIQTSSLTFMTPVYLMPVAVALGLFWFLLTLHMTKWLGKLQGKIAKQMLVND